jgi:hypothetical protein
MKVKTVRMIVARVGLLFALGGVIYTIWYEYGFGVVTADNSAAFLRTDDNINVTGQFHPGPFAGDYHSVAFDGSDLQAFKFDSPGSLYVGSDEVSDTEIVLTSARELAFFVRKGRFDKAFQGEPYSVRISRNTIVNADQLALSKGPIAVKAAWNKKSLGKWHLHLQGSSGSDGVATILIPARLPTLASFEAGIPVEVAVDDAVSPAEKTTICVGDELNKRRYFVLSNAKTDRAFTADINLAGSGLDLIMSLALDDVDACGKSPFLSNLSKSEKDKYEATIGSAQTMETFLVVSPQRGAR